MSADDGESPSGSAEPSESGGSRTSSSWKKLKGKAKKKGKASASGDKAKRRSVKEADKGEASGAKKKRESKREDGGGSRTGSPAAARAASATAEARAAVEALVVSPPVAPLAPEEVKEIADDTASQSTDRGAALYVAELEAEEQARVARERAGVERLEADKALMAALCSASSGSTQPSTALPLKKLPVVKTSLASRVSSRRLNSARRRAGSGAYLEEEVGIYPATKLPRDAAGAALAPSAAPELLSANVLHQRKLHDSRRPKPTIAASAVCKSGLSAVRVDPSRTDRTATTASPPPSMRSPTKSPTKSPMKHRGGVPSFMPDFNPVLEERSTPKQVRSVVTLQELQSKRLKAPPVQKTGGVLRVHLKRGQGLKAADVGFLRSGKSDPFVEIAAGGQQQKSKVIQANLDPEWDETFEFAATLEEIPEIELKVYDADMLGFKDALGSVQLRLDGLGRSAYLGGWGSKTFTEPLSTPGGHAAEGKLEFSVAWETPNPLDA